MEHEAPGTWKVLLDNSSNIWPQVGISGISLGPPKNWETILPARSIFPLKPCFVRVGLRTKTDTAFSRLDTSSGRSALRASLACRRCASERTR